MDGLPCVLLGNSGKICHPQNIGFDEIHEIIFRDVESMKI
jgi:hypothetical protein